MWPGDVTYLAGESPAVQGPAGAMPAAPAGGSVGFYDSFAIWAFTTSAGNSKSLPVAAEAMLMAVK
jgi:hypothetical protein